jgi:acetylornithine/N-succinyldiaminopimelate aminotransferase
LVLVNAEEAAPLVKRLAAAGLLLTLAGGRVLRFSPPLIVSVAEIDRARDILDQTLTASG